jgi:hypothetical protein
LREAFTIEQALLLDFGFAFENAPGSGYGFYRRAGDDVFTKRLARARTQTGVLAQTEIATSR